MNPGIYPNLSNEQYHADPAISRSGIMMFLESPYKYWANYVNPDRPPKESTPAMIFGSAFHTYVLELHHFWRDYAVEPEMLPLPAKVLLKYTDRETFEKYKADLARIEMLNTDTWSIFQEDSRGKIILKDGEIDLIRKMYDALCRHHEAPGLIRDAIYEQSYFWQDKDSGLMVKARPDILHSNMIVDLKTCVSASSRAFQRAMAEGGYHIQAAMIREAVNVLEGRDIPNAINVCVEKTYPYAIGNKIISETALEIGHKQFKETLMDMKECFETNVWPSYEVETVELPGWY